MRVGIKSAWIQVIGGGLFLILVTIITWWLSKPKKDKSSTQTVKEQKLDTGSISNYNSGRDLKIENNTYITKDTSKNKTKNIKPKTESKNQIINNAPNQGVQVNENKGTIVVQKPLPRDFTFEEAKKILEGYPTNFPIEIWLKGTTQESKKFFDQVVEVINKLGYSNVSTNIIGLYASTEVIDKDFQYQLENGKLIISIFPQQ